jgi:hypothetical protein
MLLPLVSPVYAEDVDSELTEARNIFLKGVDGDKHAVRTATNRFRSLSLSHPDEPVFLAYFGACMTLQGRDLQNNLEKKRVTDEGLAKIDRALEMNPYREAEGSAMYLDTLLVAANSFIHIPSFFNRYDKGKQLLNEILQHRDFAAMAPGFKAATYMTAALVANGAGNEKEYLRYLDLTVSTDPTGRDGLLAGKLLEER